MSPGPPDKTATTPGPSANDKKPKAGPKKNLDPTGVPRADRPLPETKEHGGPSGPEPTRYGDWERKGRCIDF